MALTDALVEGVFEQDQVFEELPSARRRDFQSPSTAESPKQDCGVRPSAKL
jgi:hypothetical protein